MTALNLAELPQRRWTRAEYDRLVELGTFHDERVELIYGVIVEMSPIGNPHHWAVEQLTLLLVPLALAGRARVRIQSSYAIEVSETSLDYDRGIKRRLYAETRVPEYWVVNLEERCIEVFRHPVAGAYTTHLVLGEEAVAVPEAFPDTSVPVAQLFLRS